MKRICFILGLAFVLLYSCGKKEQEKAKTKSSDETAVQPEKQRPPDSVLLIGIWQRTSKKLWIEFKPDGTFDIGKEKMVKDSNRHWHIDAEKKSLYLDFSNGAKYVPYVVNNSRLQLDFKDMGKLIDLIRIGVRPDKQP